ncbi:MAG: hypothetical protein SWQ30_06505 [Thermodesulfobacteriota bacterium]|nr:hypothetical protein [Thermodesulfobacteriota bacterium]
MYSDITTSENRLKAKRAYQRYLRKVLKATTKIYHQLHENDRAEALKAVYNINSIRHRLHEKAVELGYVKKCTDSMAVCKWQCCRWHFPKDLNHLDLFLTVCGISSEEQQTLEDRLAFDNGKYECPVLHEKGCSLSFDSRPLACSNAYPCFLGDPYHEFLEKQRNEIDVQLIVLKEILQKGRATLSGRR